MHSARSRTGDPCRFIRRGPRRAFAVPLDRA